MEHKHLLEPVFPSSHLLVALVISIILKTYFHHSLGVMVLMMKLNPRDWRVRKGSR
jgi:hypothetical protein